MAKVFVAIEWENRQESGIFGAFASIEAFERSLSARCPSFSFERVMPDGASVYRPATGAECVCVYELEVQP